MPFFSSPNLGTCPECSEAIIHGSRGLKNLELIIRELKILGRSVVVHATFKREKYWVTVTPACALSIWDARKIGQRGRGGDEKKEEGGSLCAFDIGKLRRGEPSTGECKCLNNASKP